jgi:hypothetical protein
MLEDKNKDKQGIEPVLHAAVLHQACTNQHWARLEQSSTESVLHKVVLNYSSTVRTSPAQTSTKLV